MSDGIMFVYLPNRVTVISTIIKQTTFYVVRENNWGREIGSITIDLLRRRFDLNEKDSSGSERCIASFENTGGDFKILKGFDPVGYIYSDGRIFNYSGSKQFGIIIPFYPFNLPF
ncbi:MAG: hypothetical protein ACM3UU_00985 [Ignavibacteriales bacterium]